MPNFVVINLGVYSELVHYREAVSEESPIESKNLTNNQQKFGKAARLVKLVLFSNRKSHTSFPLVRKSMTLNGVMTADARERCCS